jgi:hypothetical protein
LSEGWSVYGTSRRVSPIEHEHYVHFESDLSDSKQVTEFSRFVLDFSPEVTALVNNAGIGHFAPHEELSQKAIFEMVSVNLLAPLLLTRELLRSLKQTKGWIINMSSFSAHESSSFGAAYAATKAGLRHFGASLFEEVRRSGVKVVTLSPDITRTPFYDNLTFGPEDSFEAAVLPETVASTVMEILSKPEGTVVTEMVIRPQRILLRKGKK